MKRLYRSQTDVKIAGICGGIGAEFGIDSGIIDRAVKIANSIPCEISRSSALQYISKYLTKTKEIDRAIEVASSIPDELVCAGALRVIFTYLIATGELDRASTVTSMVADMFYEAYQ